MNLIENNKINIPLLKDILKQQFAVFDIEDILINGGIDYAKKALLDEVNDFIIQYLKNYIYNIYRYRKFGNSIEIEQLVSEFVDSVIQEKLGYEISKK